MKIGIVGHEAAKFTPAAEQQARQFIREIYDYYARITTSLPLTVVSGACHLGGIDIWAEEEADALGVQKEIYSPKTRDWTNGYKPRNIQIAKASDVLYCIVVDRLPEGYRGMHFDSCYHCHTKEHVKSGGCWTLKQAQLAGKPTTWKVVTNG